MSKEKRQCIYGLFYDIIEFIKSFSWLDECLHLEKIGRGKGKLRESEWNNWTFIVKWWLVLKPGVFLLLFDIELKSIFFLHLWSVLRPCGLQSQRGVVHALQITCVCVGGGVWVGWVCVGGVCVFYLQIKVLLNVAFTILFEQKINNLFHIKDVYNLAFEYKLHAS